jgi:iron complex outermembrane receptor protein
MFAGPRFGGIHLKTNAANRSTKDIRSHPSEGVRLWNQYKTAFIMKILVLSVVTNSALAQARVMNADSSPGGPPLEEIVVTAEKRNSTVQDTPMSLTAITGDQLQAQGISDLKGVIAEVPGISVRSSGPGQTELEMRGLASSGGSSPTVGFYLDETPLTAPPSTPTGKVVIDPDLFDLSRVEVLRGPQGTLYGSGSMGGTIKLITNKPNLQLTQGNIDATLSGTQGGGTNPGINVMLNIPLIDNVLALRLVLTEKYTSGWIDRNVLANFPFPINPCPNWGTGCTRGNVLGQPITHSYKDVNWENLTGGRISLLFKPNDDLDIGLTGMYQKIRAGGYSDYDQSPGASYEAHYQPANLAEPFSDAFDLVELSINDNLGFAQLTSASSYWRRQSAQSQDSTEAVESLIATVVGVEQFVPNVLTETDTTRQYSQELRLTSHGASRFQWLVGGFYSNLRQIYGVYNAATPFAPLSAGGADANPNGILFQGDSPFLSKQFAEFGEISYAFTDAWKVTIGLRHYNFHIDTESEQSGIFASGGSRTFRAESDGMDPPAFLPGA